MSQVYGPVPSRRLGRSLGVDLVPFKTCTYDCIYCQLGRTTHRTMDRCDWFEPDRILADLAPRLSAPLDYITLGGSGEPTLYGRLGDLIDRIHERTDVPVAVLTNGSLLGRRDVQDDLLAADLVAPSLDAGDPSAFAAVNRPHPGVAFEAMVEGLAAFRRRYRGRYWLEALLVAGRTDTDATIGRLAAQVRRIRPDRLHLNTVVRPPAESSARAVPCERLEILARRFDPPAEVIVRTDDARPTLLAAGAGVAEVLEVLRRRPCTEGDLVRCLGLHPLEVGKHLEALGREGRIAETTISGERYWAPTGRGAAR